MLSVQYREPEISWSDLNLNLKSAPSAHCFIPKNKPASPTRSDGVSECLSTDDERDAYEEEVLDIKGLDLEPFGMISIFRRAASEIAQTHSQLDCMDSDLRNCSPATVSDSTADEFDPKLFNYYLDVPELLESPVNLDRQFNDYQDLSSASAVCPSFMESPSFGVCEQSIFEEECLTPDSIFIGLHSPDLTLNAAVNSMCSYGGSASDHDHGYQITAASQRESIHPASLFNTEVGQLDETGFFGEIETEWSSLTPMPGSRKVETFVVPPKRQRIHVDLADHNYSRSSSDTESAPASDSSPDDVIEVASPCYEEEEVVTISVPEVPIKRGPGRPRKTPVVPPQMPMTFVVPKEKPKKAVKRVCAPPNKKLKSTNNSSMPSDRREQHNQAERVRRDTLKKNLIVVEEKTPDHIFRCTQTALASVKAYKSEEVENNFTVEVLRKIEELARKSDLSNKRAKYKKAAHYSKMVILLGATYYFSSLERDLKMKEKHRIHLQKRFNDYVKQKSRSHKRTKLH